MFKDENLCWKEHIKYIERKIAKNNGQYKAKSYIDKHLLCHCIILTYINYINYGNIAWGSTIRTNLEKIHNQQKNAIRIVLEYVQIWKSPSTFFAGTCYSRDHDVMGETFLLTKPINFDVNGKKILWWSIFAIEPIADFCLFFGYWPSKNTSRDHGIRGEFVSLAKPVVLCTIGKRILCWSIFAVESIADFCRLRGYWPSKNRSCDHDIKGEFVSLAKRIVFGTTRKRIWCWSVNATNSWF